MIRTALAKIFLRLSALLPLSMTHRLGSWLGWLFTVIPNDLRQTARANIGLAFPDKPDQQRESLLRQNMMEVGKAILEVGMLWLSPVDKTLTLVRQVSGLEMLESAMASGRGVLLVAPHLGCWEIIGLYVSTRWPMTTMYRPPRLKGLEQMMRTSRKRAGGKLAPTDASGVRMLYKALGRGELVAILPDQDPGRESGVFAPFFNVPANTMTLLSRLARKSDAIVLCTYAERLPNGQGYHLHFKSVAEGVGDADSVVAATHLNAAVEDCVRDLPEQYLWAYKRFKTRPQDEK